MATQSYTATQGEDEGYASGEEAHPAPEPALVFLGKENAMWPSPNGEVVSGEMFTYSLVPGQPETFTFHQDATAPRTADSTGAFEFRIAGSAFPVHLADVSFMISQARLMMYEGDEHRHCTIDVSIVSADQKTETPISEHPHHYEASSGTWCDAVVEFAPKDPHATQAPIVLLQPGAAVDLENMGLYVNIDLEAAERMCTPYNKNDVPRPVRGSRVQPKLTDSYLVPVTQNPSKDESCANPIAWLAEREMNRVNGNTTGNNREIFYNSAPEDTLVVSREQYTRFVAEIRASIANSSRGVDPEGFIKIVCTPTAPRMSALNLAHVGEHTPRIGLELTFVQYAVKRTPTKWTWILSKQRTETLAGVITPPVPS